MKGRKRHVLVDTQGLLLGVHVTAASVQDRRGAQQLLQRYRSVYPGLQLIWVDRNYSGLFPAWAWNFQQLAVEVVVPVRDAGRYSPRRWVVERTFAWLGKARRLSKDYEWLPQTSENWIYLVGLRLMLRRLAPL